MFVLFFPYLLLLGALLMRFDLILLLIANHIQQRNQLLHSCLLLLLVLKLLLQEGNWMTLQKDVKTPGAGYDSIICMGNSFPHLIDDHGDLRSVGGDF